MKVSKIKILELRTVSGTGGGPEKTIFLTSRYINSSRFETHIVYTRNPQDSQYNWMRKHWTLPHHVIYQDLVERHSFDIGILRFIKTYCLQNQIQLIHSHEYKTDVIARWVAPKLSLKWVSTFHAPAQGSLKMCFYQWLAYRALKKADKIFLVSPHQKSLLLRQRLSLNQLQLLPNGVETNVFQPQADLKHLRAQWKIPTASVVFGFLGRLCEEKNLLFLLETFGKVSREFPQAFLVLGGEGPERKKVQERLAALKLEKNCLLVGFQEDPISFYSAIDVYVQTSITEQMPNTILEAMAMGLPLISSKVGGVPFLIDSEGQGLLFDSGNSDQLRNYMLKLLKDQELRIKLGSQAREKVKSNFSFESRVRKLEGVYEQLCARGG